MHSNKSQTYRENMSFGGRLQHERWLVLIAGHIEGQARNTCKRWRPRCGRFLGETPLLLSLDYFQVFG